MGGSLSDAPARTAPPGERFFTLALDLFCIADFKGRFRRVNPAFSEVLGWTAEELCGRPFLDFVHPDDHAATLAETGTLAEGAATIRFRNRYRCKDGSWRWLSWNAYPEPAEALIFATARDVTEIHQAQEALRAREADVRLLNEHLEEMVAARTERLQRSEERYRLLVEQMADGIFVADAEGRFLDVNGAGAAMFGYTRDELLERRIQEVVGAVEAPRLAPQLARLTGGRVARSEWRLRRKDGSPFLGELMGRQLADGRLQGVLRDITERRQLEAQVQQGQRMECVGRLAGGIAHDFNNLLTVILGTVDLALQHAGPGDRLHADLQDVRGAADRAAALTRQLLAFSRKQVLQPKVLSLNTVVSDTLSMLGRLVGEDITVRFVQCGDLQPVKADPGQLEQVLANLVVNARDAMPAGGTLTIETANVELDADYAAEHPSVQPGPHVMLAVSDTGCGMDEETRRQIFEPFFTTKGPGKGTGLGLATVYGIVKQSGGSVWVYSEVGRGTTFKIYLPRAEGPQSGPAGVPAAPGARGSETVLVVEDEEALRRLAERSLERAGYTVLTAAGGAEALALLERHEGRVALVVTDVIMPGMSGRELATRVSERYPRVRLVFTSGYTDDAIVERGELEADTHFLGKPYTAAALTGKVREVLDR
jgi:PAS domain S-box-containing protein